MTGEQRKLVVFLLQQRVYQLQNLIARGPNADRYREELAVAEGALEFMSSGCGNDPIALRCMWIYDPKESERRRIVGDIGKPEPWILEEPEEITVPEEVPAEVPA